MSVSCNLVVTCLEKADLLALLYMMFSCVFVTFSCVLGQVWYLIVSIHDICLLSYFYTEAPFLDWDLSITNGIVSSKIYNTQYDFNLESVNFLFLDGDVPRTRSYGVLLYIFCN